MSQSQNIQSKFPKWGQRLWTWAVHLIQWSSNQRNKAGLEVVIHDHGEGSQKPITFMRKCTYDTK